METTAKDSEESDMKRTLMKMRGYMGWCDGCIVGPRERFAKHDSRKWVISTRSTCTRRSSRAEAQRRGIKTLRTRWFDVTKGFLINPNHRSLLVAMQFNTTKLDGLFASTLPLEALKLLISDVATKDDVHGDALKEGQEKVIMVNDIARA